jgi:hypothetical protein
MDASPEFCRLDQSKIVLSTDESTLILDNDQHNSSKSESKTCTKHFHKSQITTIEEGCQFAQRWLPPITLENKLTLISVLTGTEVSFGTPLLRKYIELLRPYTDILGISGEDNRPREADCAASGIVFFYGCLCYIMHFPGWGQHIEDIFLYNLLYILVDHYIDDIKVNSIDKKHAISQMYILIMDPSQHERLPLIDPILKTIAIVYQRLITRCPDTKKSIIKLFEAEIEGLTIQKDSSSSREKYYDIAIRKGGYTMQVLQHIVGDTDPTITDASFHIGTIMQLIDDSVDVIADQKNGIHTIASYDLQNKGNLDELWIDIMNRIRNIDARFTIFTFLYTVFTVYLPDRIRDCYSESLRQLTNPLNLFDYTYGCDGSLLLVHAVTDELSTMDALDTLRSVV